MIRYPVFNIDVVNCNEELFSEMFFYNSVFYDYKDRRAYLRYYQGKRFVDINGNVYLLVGIEDNSNWLRTCLNLKRKYSMIFKPLNMKLSFQQVRQIYLNSLQGFESEEAKEKFVLHANSCNTLDELL